MVKLPEMEVIMNTEFHEDLKRFMEDVIDKCGDPDLVIWTIQNDTELAEREKHLNAKYGKDSVSWAKIQIQRKILCKVDIA